MDPHGNAQVLRILGLAPTEDMYCEEPVPRPCCLGFNGPGLIGYVCSVRFAALVSLLLLNCGNWVPEIFQIPEVL